MLGDIETQIWGVPEIRGFVIRGFPFPQKSANCKDFLYFLVNLGNQNFHLPFSFQLTKSFLDDRHSHGHL